MRYRHSTRKYGEKQKDTERFIIQLAGLAAAFIMTRCVIGIDISSTQNSVAAFAPLGLALLLGYSLAGFPTAAPLLGLLASCLLRTDVLWQVMASGALYCVVQTVLAIFNKKPSTAITLCLFMLCQIVFMPLVRELNALSIAMGALSILVSAGCGLVIRNTVLFLSRMNRRTRLTTENRLCLTASLAFVLAGLYDASYLGVSIPTVVMLFFSVTALWILHEEGIALCAMLIGCFVLLTGQALATAGVVAIGAALSLFMSSFGRFYALGGFYIAALITGGGTGLHVVNAQNLLFSSVLFCVIPTDALELLRSMLCPQLAETQPRDVLTRIRRHAADSLKSGAQLVGELAVPLLSPRTAEGSDPLNWAIGSALRVCSECEARVLCGREPEAHERALAVLLHCELEGRKPQLQPPIDPECHFVSQLCVALRIGYEQAGTQLAGIRHMDMRMSYLRRQLSGISQLLYCDSERVLAERWQDEDCEKLLAEALLTEGVNLRAVDVLYPAGVLLIRLSIDREGDETRAVETVSRLLRLPLAVIDSRIEGASKLLELEEEPRLSISMHSAQLPHSRGAVSGDSIASCRLHKGRALYVLSDGMGSGENAKSASDSCITLLMNLFRAGLPGEMIYENVNRMLMAKRRDESYATLDAVAVDLSSGKAELVKFGAPPTCYVRGSKLWMLSGEALPCGIVDEAKPSLTRFILRRNDMLVFCSDGVYDALENELCDIVLSHHDEDGAELARALIKEAAREGIRDDMSVMVLKVA